MPILILLVLLVPTLSAVWKTHDVFSNAYLWEERQIALDNAAILIGRGDREMFNAIVSANQSVKTLEALHHPLHLCARAGDPSGVCLSDDLAIEAMIQVAHATTYRAALTKWIGTRVNASSPLRGIESRLIEIKRAALPPIAEKRCPICGLGASWEVPSGNQPVRTSIHSRGAPPLSAGVMISGGGLLESRNWNYQLVEGGGL